MSFYRIIIIEPNKTTDKIKPDVITPFTEAIGPGFPNTPFTSSKPIIIARTQKSSEKFASIGIALG